MIGGFLFDVDGTLIDSNDLHAEAWREAFLHFGVDVPLNAVRGQIGKGGDNLIPALLPEDLVARRQKEIEEFRSELFQREYLPRARPFPSVRALFERIRADGIPLVLASSAKRVELDHHIGLLGVADLVTATTSKDDVEHSKPSPDIFAAALAKLGVVAPADARVVGDSPYDVEAARLLGIRAVGFRSGGFPEAELRRAGASLVLDGAAEMVRRYDELFSDGAAEALDVPAVGEATTSGR